MLLCWVGFFLRFYNYFEISPNFLRKSFFFFFPQFSVKYKFRTWISGRNLRLKYRNPVEINHEGGKLLPWKFCFSGNFYCYETKFPVAKKFTYFCAMLGNILVYVRISYCRWEVIIFLFYQKLKTIHQNNVFT